MKDFLQRLCPECGEKAETIAREKPNTRTCPNGHTWFPVKNPEPKEETE